MPIIPINFPAGAAAGPVFGVGTVPALFIRRISSQTRHALPAFAAGTMIMIFVISQESILDPDSRNYENHKTFGLIVGLIVMMFLDVVLG